MAEVRYCSASPGVNTSFSDRLPTELLQKIFTGCCGLEGIDIDIPDNCHSGHFQNQVGHYPISPIILSQVCRRWRVVSLGTTEMWNSLLIVAGTNARCGAKAEQLYQLSEVSARRLSLAGRRPLTISIQVSAEFVIATAALINTVISFSSQWHAIHFQVPTRALALLTCLQSSDVPVLHSLRIQEMWNSLTDVISGEPQQNTVESISLHICRAAPQLRRLWLSQFPRTTTNIPFSHITEFLLDAPSETSQLLMVLEQCLNLRSLTLSGYGLTIHPVEQDLMVNLPHLSSLHLKHPDGRARFLQHVELPSLRSLAITGMGNPVSSTTLLSALMHLCTRSGCGLTSLRFHMLAHGFEYEALIQFLQHFPSLKSLTIDETYMAFSPAIASNELLSALTSKSNSETLCPDLNYLELIMCLKFSDPVLQEFLQSRRSTSRLIVYKSW